MRTGSRRNSISRKPICQRKRKPKTQSKSTLKPQESDLASTSLDQRSKEHMVQFNSYESKIKLLENELKETQILNKAYARQLKDANRKLKQLEGDLKVAHTSREEFESYKQQIVEKYRRHLEGINSKFQIADLKDNSTSTEEVWGTLRSDEYSLLTTYNDTIYI